MGDTSVLLTTSKETIEPSPCQLRGLRIEPIDWVHFIYYLMINLEKQKSEFIRMLLLPQ